MNAADPLSVTAMFPPAASLYHGVSRAGVLILGPEGDIRFSNTDARAILGLTPEQLHGQAFFDLFARAIDEDGRPIPPAARLVARVLASDRRVAGEVFGVYPTGAADPVWLRISTDPEIGPDGQVVQILYSFVDVTAFRHAAKALQESERRFREMLEQIRLIAIMLDCTGRITFVNAFLLQLTSWDAEEVIGRDWFEIFVPPDQHAPLKAAFEDWMQGRVEYSHFENPIQTRQGERRLISWNNTILRNVQGQMIGTASIGEDITEQKASEAALSASETRFAKVFRASPDAIVITRLQDGQIIDANDAWCALTGYSRGEAARLGTTRGAMWADPMQWDAMYMRARRDGAVRDFDFAFRTKASEIRLGNLSADVVNIEGQDCLLTITRDTTTRRRLEAQMLATERQNALGRLAAGVAHEFNNILTGIMGRIDLLALDTKDPNDAATLRLIQKALDDGAAVVRRVQAFARSTTPGEFHALAVGELVNDVISLTQAHWQVPQMPGSRITLRTQIEQGLAVQGNATEMREVLTNLILNAVDALPHGGRLFVGAEASGANVVLSVCDNGVGMDAATQEYIFEPFFTTKATGNGLGLAVVKDIVQRHNGEIKVVSNRGKGTLFTITLPAAPEVSALPALSVPLAPTTPARILAVDDDPGLGPLLQSMLAVAGHDVIVATNGAEALALLEQVPFDLVCTDLGMPGMNGWEVARYVRARAPGIPVILITGWGVQLDPAEMAAHTVDFVLSKPYRVAQVLEVVAQALALPHEGC
jgi:PAS domain S-box-containing protein